MLTPCGLSLPRTRTIGNGLRNLGPDGVAAGVAGTETNTGAGGSVSSLSALFTQPGSARSILPSPSLSIPSAHWAAGGGGGGGGSVSSLSVLFTQPGSVRSILPSPSLSIPSAHWAAAGGGGGGSVSSLSALFTQPGSARSILPSPSLSFRSEHCVGGGAANAVGTAEGPIASTAHATQTSTIGTR